MAAVEPQIMEIPPEYEEVMTSVEYIDDIEENVTKSEEGKPNKGFEQEDYLNHIQITVGQELTGKVNQGHSDKGDKVRLDDVRENKTHPAPMTKEEQKMLSTLREIVRICMHANPKKRPTSYDVVKILQGHVSSVKQKNA